MKLNGIARPVIRQALVLKKNSPHIFFGAGMVGFASTVVLACRATLKLDEKLTDMQKDLEATQSGYEDDSDEINRAVIRVYAKHSYEITKLYGPAVVVGGLTVGALTGSHVQLTRRNTALAGTLAIVTKAYEDFRARVEEEVGTEKARDLYLGFKEEPVTDEDGKITIAKVKAGDTGPFSRLFDEGSWQWSKDADYVWAFLQGQQLYANDLLHAKGHLFLNDVLRSLGFDDTKEGAIYGWVVQDNGDNYVSFGIDEIRNAGFLNPMEPRVWLTFNVHGVIYDLI